MLYLEVLLLCILSTVVGMVLFDLCNVFLTVVIQDWKLMRLLVVRTGEDLRERSGRNLTWWAPTTNRGRSLIDSNEGWVEVLSWKPRAFYFHNFISEEDADHLIRLALPYMKRSTVVGQNGDSVLDDVRTSYGTFIRRNIDDVATRMEEKVARWSRTNMSHQEDTQILRYGLGQKYGAHMDVLEEGSPRMATVLIYLSTPEEGGETAFPRTTDENWVSVETKDRLGSHLSDCAKGHVAAPIKKGDALMFWSLNPDGHSRDGLSMHTGCPVVKGVKWTATKWVHNAPFRPETFGVTYPDPPLPENCEDSYELCQQWADAEECTKNPTFMVGDGFSLGGCRLACGMCQHCEDADSECKKNNRVKSGYLPYEATD